MIRGMKIYIGTLPLAVWGCTNTYLFVLMAISPSFCAVRKIYNFNTLAMPAILAVAVIATLVLWRARGRDGQLRRVRALAAVAVLLFGVRIYATNIEPHMLLVKKVEIATSKVDRPVKILHISDIQSERIGWYERRAFKKMRQLEPDIILHTGDLLQPNDRHRYDDERKKLSELFDTLSPPLGVYGVIGDTDWRLYDVASSQLGGLRHLTNQQVGVVSEDVDLSLFGLSLIESHDWQSGREDVKRWHESTSDDQFTILMGHAPDYVMDVKDLSIDLCLAGHTHGGQIRIPFIGPIVTASNIPRRLARGFNQVGRTCMNVSAGVGSEHKDAVPPLRIFCPTEMTLITLVPEHRAEKGEESRRAPSTRIFAALCSILLLARYK